MKWLVGALLASCLFACGGVPGDELAKGEERPALSLETNPPDPLIGIWCDGTTQKVSADASGAITVIYSSNMSAYPSGYVIYDQVRKCPDGAVECPPARSWGGWNKPITHVGLKHISPDPSFNTWSPIDVEGDTLNITWGSGPWTRCAL